MANDYNGYIATYREYQRGDHYRKALTAWGPHSSDYMATRLVTLGRRLKSPSEPLPTDQEQEEQLQRQGGGRQRAQTTRGRRRWARPASA